MALVVGVNCGLVEESPTEAASGSGSFAVDNFGRCIRIETGANPITITEIGFYVPQRHNTEFEVGVYSHDSVNDQPKDLLFVSRSHQTGTSPGWKKVTELNYNLSSSTVYWLAIQVDDLAESLMNTNWDNAVGERNSYTTPMATLPDLWEPTDNQDDIIIAVYGVFNITTEQASMVFF